MTSKNAYFYYLFNDFNLMDMLASHQTLLEAGTSVPVYCLTCQYVSEIARRILKGRGVHIIETTDSDIEELLTFDGKLTGMLYCIRKLNLFSLTQFDTIVYLDADTYVVKNIDELFSIKADSAVSDYGRYKNQSMCNGGLLVIHPRDKFMEDFSKFLHDTFSSCTIDLTPLQSSSLWEPKIEPGFITKYVNDYSKAYPMITDQEYLSLYLKYWFSRSKHLPYIYNYQGPYFDEDYPILFDVGSVKVFHFCGSGKKVYSDNVVKCTDPYLKQILYKYVYINHSLAKWAQETYGTDLLEPTTVQII